MLTSTPHSQFICSVSFRRRKGEASWGAGDAGLDSWNDSMLSGTCVSISMNDNRRLISRNHHGGKLKESTEHFRVNDLNRFRHNRYTKVLEGQLGIDVVPRVLREI
jgi:hypothetical protein